MTARLPGLQIAAAALVLLLCIACGQAGEPGSPDPAGCRETITDHVTAATTWRNGPEECDYFVPGREIGAQIINVQAALSIEPGTVVVFGHDVRLNFTDSGSLDARGTAENPVILRGAEEQHGYWYGLCFGAIRESVLDHVQLWWAGKVWSGGSSVCNGAVAGSSTGFMSAEPVHITNSLIHGSSASGISAHGFILGDFSNNVLSGNLGYGARVHTRNVSSLGPGNYLGPAAAPNGLPYIHVSREHSEPRGPELWRNHDAAYHIDNRSDAAYTGPFAISDGVQITIEAGTDFVMGAGTAFMIVDGASLQADGTDSAPVTFRGDENTPGHWQDLYFSGAAGSRLEHVQVDWAGGYPDGTRRAAVYVYRPAGVGAVELTDVGVRGSSTCAVRAVGDTGQDVVVTRLRLAQHNTDFDVLCGTLEPI